MLPYLDYKDYGSFHNKVWANQKKLSVVVPSGNRGYTKSQMTQGRFHERTRSKGIKV